MTRFKLSGRVVISLYTEVEAETIEEAIEIAKDRELMSIVDNGYNSQEDSWMADELDGTVEGIVEA
jgi:hypothetical protein